MTNTMIEIMKTNKITWIGYVVCALGLVLITIGIMNYATSSNTKQMIVENAYDCEELQLYLKKFYRDIEYFGINKRMPRSVTIKLAPMQFFDDTKDYHGVSYGYGNDDIIEIYINENSWKKLSRPQKYFLMYHELSHDVLNVDDLPDVPQNYGRLMCPVLSSINKISMDEFIEMTHLFFEEQSR